MQIKGVSQNVRLAVELFHRKDKLKMKNSIKSQVPMLTVLLISLITLIFTNFTKGIRNWVLVTWLPIILLIIAMGAIVYYIVMAKKKIIPVIVSIIALGAGVLISVPKLPPKYFWNFRRIILLLKNPHGYGISLSFMGQGLFVTTIIVFIALLVTLILQILKLSYQKETAKYAVLAMPQYGKYLAEYQASNGEPDEMTEAKLFAKALQYITLKAPATAVFAELNEISASKTQNGYTVSGFVDSQNSYGAMVRTQFTLNIYKDGGNWATTTTFAAQTTGKVASRLLVYWIIGIVVTLLTSGILYFAMFG